METLGEILDFIGYLIILVIWESIWFLVCTEKHYSMLTFLFVGFFMMFTPAIIKDEKVNSGFDSLSGRSFILSLLAVFFVIFMWFMLELSKISL